MPEKKVLNTLTEINQVGSDIDIFTYYSVRDEDIRAFIANSVFSENGTAFIEGQLGITKWGFEDTDFFVNEDGDLVVLSDDPDRFAINGDGQLTITE